MQMLPTNMEGVVDNEIFFIERTARVTNKDRKLSLRAMTLARNLRKKRKCYRRLSLDLFRNNRWEPIKIDEK